MSDSATSTSPHVTSHASVWAVSLLFWTTLLFAVLLYAAVALAPKLLVWTTARQQYIANAHRLIALEDEVDYLERVQQALETDPGFVQRVASASSAPASTALGEDSEEWVPVSGSLMFGRDENPNEIPVVDPKPPPLLATVAVLAGNERLRTGLLATACVLVVFACTFLNDAGHGLVRSAWRLTATVVRLPVARYVRQPEPSASEEPDDEPPTAHATASDVNGQR